MTAMGYALVYPDVTAGHLIASVAAVVIELKAVLAKGKVVLLLSRVAMVIICALVER